ncbi:MAG: hypothetical protein ACPIA1_04465 [Flavobacteriaceae bacterium]
MKNRIKSLVISFGLLGVLILPNINQWAHLSKGHHEEGFCTKSDTHYHQSEQNCSLEFTFITPYTPVFDFHDQLGLSEIHTPSFFNRKTHYFYSQLELYYLRGPPEALLCNLA